MSVMSMALLSGSLLAGAAPAEKTAPAPAAAAAPVKVVMTTSAGVIEMELDRAKAPISVDNFVKYAKAGHYTKTIFHRVIPGFMVQGGGMDDKLVERRTGAPIKNESSNGLKNLRGTLAMARTSAPDSATAQFFINVVDNSFLDGQPGQPGYAVFGKVTKGMDVVDKIVASPRGRMQGFDDVPLTPVVIQSVTVQ